jgi:hypothetical protein
MISARSESIMLVLAMALGYLVGTPAAFAGDPDASQGFERCKTIADNQARLDCLKKLLAPAASPEARSAQDSWPLIVTHHPAGGRDAVAIMRTADTGRSDPDLAGLMIRCEEKPGFEVLLALVRPFPPRAQRDVVVGSGTTQLVLHAEASALGTGLILPIEATLFTTGPWQGLKELTVAIKDPETEIRGVIPLDGLAPAMAKLSASCPSG